MWVCHFPEQQHVTLPCWKNGAWTSRSVVASGGGVLYNPSRCSVAASGFQTMPELLGDTKAIPDAPYLFVPDKTALVAGHELRLLEGIILSKILRFDEVTTEVTAPR